MKAGYCPPGGTHAPGVVGMTQDRGSSWRWPGYGGGHTAPVSSGTGTAMRLDETILFAAGGTRRGFHFRSAAATRLVGHDDLGRSSGSSP